MGSEHRTLVTYLLRVSIITVLLNIILYVITTMSTMCACEGVFFLIAVRFGGTSSNYC